MNKFLFKSNPSDLQKIYINKFDMILSEQRHQRSDLSILIRMMNKLINSTNLQKQVDEFFDDSENNIPEVEKVEYDGNNKDSN